MDTMNKNNNSIPINSFKLAKLLVFSLRDKNYINNRIVNIWKSLPDCIVTSNFTPSFERNLYWSILFIKVQIF